MATAKQVDNDIFTCPICFEIIKSPKSLPCLHSFCEQCICKYIVTLNTKETDTIKDYPCPVCRTVSTPSYPEVDVSKWAALLPTNFNLLIDSTHDKEEQECNPCKRRGQSSRGILYCSECMECLCQNCSDCHSSLKLSMNHKVMKIENNDTSVLGIDLNAISDLCSVHSAKYTEVFCYIHKKLCCVLCLTLEHRKCDNVKAISEKDQVQKVQIKKTIKTTELAIKELLSEKQRQIEQFDISVKTAEDKASKLVAGIKDKLDRLLLSFSKELSLLGDGDDERCKLEDEINVLTTLFKNVSRMSEVTSLVSDHGSAIQQFINTDNVKSQIGSSILESIENFNSRESVRIKLIIDSLLENVNNLSGLGKLSIVRSPETTNSQVFEKISENIILIRKQIRSLPVAINAKLKKVERFPQRDFTCGVSISNSVVICGNDNGNVEFLYLVNAAQKHTCRFDYCKRITVNRNRNTFYVANKYGLVASFSFNAFDGFTRQLSFDTTNLQGMTVFEGDIYVVVVDTIRKFSEDATVASVDDMITCFKAYTNCSAYVVNGLAIDAKNRHLIYTSKNNEIICTTLEGKQLFCLKDTKIITNPTSVTVHSSGLILVGSGTGSVHAIDPNGYYQSTLIKKCEKITRLSDIWLDQKEQTLFLCGGEYIEMYDIFTEKLEDM